MKQIQESMERFSKTEKGKDFIETKAAEFRHLLAQDPNVLPYLLANLHVRNQLLIELLETYGFQPPEGT